MHSRPCSLRARPGQGPGRPRNNADLCEPLKEVHSDLCSDCTCPEQAVRRTHRGRGLVGEHVGKRSEKGQEQEWNLTFTIFHINAHAVIMVFVKLFWIFKKWQTCIISKHHLVWNLPKVAGYVSR